MSEAKVLFLIKHAFISIISSGFKSQIHLLNAIHLSLLQEETQFIYLPSLVYSSVKDNAVQAIPCCILSAQKSWAMDPGLSDACTGSLTTRTGSPTGNEINKNSIPRQKVQQRLGYFSGEMVSTEWYVQVKTLMDTVCFLSLYLAVVEMHALPFSLLFYRETRKCNGYSAHLALLNFACTSLHCCRVQG